MKRLLALSLPLAFAVAGTVGAHAQDRDYRENDHALGPYIGAGYTYLDFNEEFGGEGDVHALTGRVGWQIIPFLSVEAEASFGVDDDGFDFDGNEDDFDLDDDNDGSVDDVISGPGELGLDYLVGIFARANFPVHERVDIFARGGYAFVEVDSTVQTIGGNQLIFGGSDDGFAIGGGASFDLTRALVLRAEYTRYELDDADANGVSASLNFKFGGL